MDEGDHKCQDLFYCVVSEDPAQVTVLSPGKYLIMPQENIAVSPLRIVTHPSRSDVTVDAGGRSRSETISLDTTPIPLTADEDKHQHMSEQLSNCHVNDEPRSDSPLVEALEKVIGTCEVLGFKEISKDPEPVHMTRDEGAIHEFYFTNSSSRITFVGALRQRRSRICGDGLPPNAYLDTNHAAMILRQSSSLLSACQLLDENYIPHSDLSASANLVRLSPDESFLQVCYVMHKDAIDNQAAS